MAFPKGDFYGFSKGRLLWLPSLKKVTLLVFPFEKGIFLIFPHLKKGDF